MDDNDGFMLSLESKKYFGGAGSARDGHTRSFVNLQITSKTENRPLIVFPDGHIFVETFSPFYEKAIDFVVAISEPISRPKYVHEYQITVFSLIAAISVGIKQSDIIKFLKVLSKTEISPELIKQIEDTADYVGKLKLVLKNNRFFIESSRLDILNNISNDPVFRKARKKPKDDDPIDPDTRYILADDDDLSAIIAGIGEVSQIDDSTRFLSGMGGKDNASQFNEPLKVLRFEVSDDKIETIRARAIELNIPLSDEYAFHNDKNDNLSIEMKSTTYIRPYQEKSLSKMFSGGRAKSGIIVLPCGAGKTLVGIVAATTIHKSTIVFCNSNIPVNQWKDQFTKWTDVDPSLVIPFTRLEKHDLPQCPCIVITTYAMVSYSGKHAERTEEILKQIRTRDWGLMILDEVHEAVSSRFRTVMTSVKAHTKLGLSATLVREDYKIADLRHLIGPKLYEANWSELTDRGFLARVQCFEVRCKMTGPFFKEYLKCEPRDGLKKILAALNPNKMNTLDQLLKYHEGMGDKILVFCDIIWVVKHLAKIFNKYLLCGEVSDDERQEVFDRFRSTNPEKAINVIVISKIGDKAIDLPLANVLIQVSSHFGSRMQEAQRLGRILRPKKMKENDEFNAFFYTLISEDTDDVYFSAKRQQFLVDQGYAFDIIQNPEEIVKRPNDMSFLSNEEQNTLLEESKKTLGDDRAIEDDPNDNIN